MSRIDQSNIDEYIQKKISNTKSDFITLGVSFNKNCPRQISLLKKALLQSSSFSGLMKEYIAQGDSPKQSTTKQHHKQAVNVSADGWI